NLLARAHRREAALCHEMTFTPPGPINRPTTMSRTPQTISRRKSAKIPCNDKDHCNKPQDEFHATSVRAELGRLALPRRRAQTQPSNRPRTAAQERRISVRSPGK